METTLSRLRRLAFIVHSVRGALLHPAACFELIGNDVKRTPVAQIDALAKDASYNGINLLFGDDLKVLFNENGSSSLTIAGVTYDAASLGLSTVSGIGFQSDTVIDAALGDVPLIVEH